MTDLDTSSGKRPGQEPQFPVSPRRGDAFALTWFIGVATAIVAGGYLFLAQSSRDELRNINMIATQSALYPERKPVPMTDYSTLSEPPAELRN